jgi:hypothetical protein
MLLEEYLHFIYFSCKSVILGFSSKKRPQNKDCLRKVYWSERFHKIGGSTSSQEKIAKGV